MHPLSLWPSSCPPCAAPSSFQVHAARLRPQQTQGGVFSIALSHCAKLFPPACARAGLSTRHRICPTWNIHGDGRTEQGRPGHFVLQCGWHWCVSCPSLTNLAGLTAVQSLPLPTAAVRSSETFSSAPSAFSPRASGVTPHQADAKETSSVPILPPSIHTQTTHDISTVPFIPKGSPLGGKEAKSWELSLFAPCIRLEEQREDAPSPALLLGIPAAFAPGAHGSTWHWPPAAAAATPFRQPSRPSPAPSTAGAPCAPSAPAPTPPAASAIAAALLLPGLSSGKCYANRP